MDGCSETNSVMEHLARVEGCEQGWVGRAFEEALMSRVVGFTMIKTVHQIAGLGTSRWNYEHKLLLGGDCKIEEHRCLHVRPFHEKLPHNHIVKSPSRSSPRSKCKDDTSQVQQPDWLREPSVSRLPAVLSLPQALLRLPSKPICCPTPTRPSQALSPSTSRLPALSLIHI